MDRGINVNLAILSLRLGIGAIFVAHGMQKLFGYFNGPGIEGVTKMIQGMGLAPAVLWAWILILTEFVGGIFLILGVLPRISAGLISVVMAVAIVKVHGPNGFFMSASGFEFQLLILLVCVALILTGGGKFSLYDRL